jgi:hypothetical protein
MCCHVEYVDGSRSGYVVIVCQLTLSLNCWGCVVVTSTSCKGINSILQ